jgi:hypothetical protein
MAASG